MDNLVNRILVGSTVLLRVCLTLASVSIIANALSVHEFGEFITAVSVGTIAGILTNGGLPVALLRDTVGDFKKGSQLLRKSIRLKIYLDLAALLLIFSWVFYTSNQKPTATYSILPLVLGLMFGSTCDLYFSFLRSQNLYFSELKIALLQSIAQLLLVLTVSVLHPTILHLAVAFVCPRVITLAYILRRVRPFQTTNLIREDSATTYAKTTALLALDSICVNLIMQIDGIFVAWRIGLDAAGTYQAGTRLAYGALPFASALNGITVPSLTRTMQTPVGLKKMLHQLSLIVLEYSFVGVIGGIILVIVGPLYVNAFLTSEYEPVNALWKPLAVYLALRFLISGLGVVLIVIGPQIWRSITLVLVVITVAVVLSWLTPSSDLVDVVWLMTVSALMQLGAFAIIIICKLMKERT